MAIVSIQTLPAGTTAESVKAVSALVMAGGNPGGIYSHTIYENAGNFVSIDVWESEAAMNAFLQDRLMPAVAQFAASMGLDASQMPTPEPPAVYTVVEAFPQG